MLIKDMFGIQHSAPSGQTTLSLPARSSKLWHVFTVSTASTVLSCTPNTPTTTSSPFSDYNKKEVINCVMHPHHIIGIIIPSSSCVGCFLMVASIGGRDGVYM